MNDGEHKPCRVLVTGSAGAVGQVVCAALAQRGHHVRGFDRCPTRGVEDAVVGSVGDGQALRSAMAGMDTIVHLASGTGAESDAMEKLLEPNVIGLFNVMDAARDGAVRRVVLASSLQVVLGMDESEKPRGTDDAAPTTRDALTKRWGEQMGEMYARLHGLSVICGRITWMPRDAEEIDRLTATSQDMPLYVSPRDTGRFFTCAVEAQGVDFAILYCAGPPHQGRSRFDMDPGRRLIGYEPADVFPEGLGFAWSASD